MDNRWWTEETVAVVTGGNRGIGYGIVRSLAQNGIRVILTDRDSGGTATVNTLNDDGFNNVVFYQLDVQDEMAIQGFANWMKKHYGKLDILVNNAGVAGRAINYDLLKANNADLRQILYTEAKVEGISENYESAKECININYYGTKRMVKALFPLLEFASEGGARIVNVSSRAGVLEFFPSETLRQQLGDLENLTEDKIDTFVESFLKDFQDGSLNANGWPVQPDPAYFVSKAAVSAYTRILAHQNPNMYVNCVHPGYVKTDMTFHTGVMSIEEGAEGPVMLALLPPGSPSGQYFNKKELASFYVLDKLNTPL